MNTSVSSFNWIRYSFGLVVLLAGLDKLAGTNLIVEWAKYVSFPVADVIPAATVVLIVGIIEVIAGILMFTRQAATALYAAAALLVLIAINLLMIGGYLDIAIRDLLLAIAAFAAARLAPAALSARA